MPTDSERHARHDALLVAAFAAGDLADGERERAAALVAECGECRSLHDDLLTIARATAALPAAVRPRDFRIAPEQAARLRPAGWRRFVAAFASPRLAMTRQLGVGLTTLGLAGLLISSIPSFSLGGMAAGASPAPEHFSVDASQGEAAASPAAAPAASAAPAFGPDDGQTLQGSGGVLLPEPVVPAATDAVTSENDAAAGGGTQRDTAAGVEEGGGAIAPGGPDDRSGSLLPVVSAILLAAGLVLLLARRAARRMVVG